MKERDLSASTASLVQEANQHIIDGDYDRAASVYERAINKEPDNRYYYWQLGLILLLQGQEVEAQTIWSLGMAEGEAKQVEGWTQELVEVLDREANYQTGKEDYSMALAIRQHIREIQPHNINNLLSLIDLSVILESYTEEELIQLEIVPLLQTKSSLEPNQKLLLHILKKLLVVAPIDKTSIEFAKTCLAYVKETQHLINIFLPAVYNIAYSFQEIRVAIEYLQILLSLAPEHQELLRTIAQFYVDITDFTKGIEYAKRCYSITSELCDRISDNHAIVRAIMFARGYDEEVRELIERQKSLLEALIEEKPENLGTSASLTRLYSSSFFFPYVRDIPRENVKLRHQVAQVCQINIEKSNQQTLDKCRDRLSAARSRVSYEKKLKIGYLSHCLKRHSVGWIARWLFEYHDRDRFDLFAYLLAAESSEDSLREWYVDRADNSYKYDVIGGGVAEQICEDGIDVLIDLDSVTLTNTCKIIALKPAPVQVTWLGWDASGIPTVDYYIADPYVLPENAQEYYSEKIWRLPQTYLAVNGFEVGLPTLRRDQLNIIEDAVVYLSVQKGPKYNPQMLRLQMRILRDVPNSYFLIKGFGNEDFMNDVIISVAAEEGVGRDRIRFIDRVGFEETHRANLAIADVVLDTYPYNGATTTLETLWMGVPMVTKVGEQFAARNSYTMMVNAGISEGIAWTDEEYLQWGIKLGRDENLRKQISWKLKKSRQTAPLWNAKQFTREMENAYQQMWQKYVDGN